MLHWELARTEVPGRTVDLSLGIICTRKLKLRPV